MVDLLGWLERGWKMPKRFKTDYPGVFFREVDRIGGKGKERVYYVVYKRNGKTVEAKAGRQFSGDMTPARANQYRTALIEGRAVTPQEQRQAEQAAKEAEQEAREVKQSRWTIAKLWDLYGETYSQNKVIKHEGHKFDNYLRKEVGDKEPCELQALDVDRLRIRLQKQGKHTTAARVLELLRRTVNFGLKRGLTPPLSFKIEVPKLNNEVTEDLTEGEVQALLNALNTDPDQKAANVMRLALYSGMRRSEILKLRWEDVDFERGFIRLVDPKGGRDQIIPMNGYVRTILTGIERVQDNPFVFPGKFPGTHLTECRISLNRIKKAAGLPKGFRPLHGLRHSFASTLASSGQCDLFTLQRLLTHKSPLMTQRYAHLRDDALKRASELAGDLIQKATNGKSEGKVANLSVVE